MAHLDPVDPKENPNNDALSEAVSAFKGKVEDSPLESDITKWRFSISSNDATEIIHGISSKVKDAESRRANLAIIRNLGQIVRNAFPAESYRDIKASQGVKGVDENLKGIHRFYSPVVVGDGEYLVKITVKDRTGDGSKGIGGKDRLGAYQIIGIETEKAQSITKPLNTGEGDAPAEARPKDPNLEVLGTPTTRYSSDEITVREMLSGVKRDGDVVYVKKTGADGKEYWAKDETRRTRFFTEEPNQWAYEEKGGYWKDPNDQSGDLLQISDELFQLAYHGSPYVFDTFTLSHIGSGQGAQSHGWGLYFALTREVSEGYVRRLTNFQSPKYHISDGRVLEGINSIDSYSADFDTRMISKVIYEITHDSNERSETPVFSAESVQKKAKEILARHEPHLAKWQRKKPRTDEARREKEYWVGQLSGIVNALKKLIESPVSIEKETPGRLYTVDIPEDDVMLREDARLSDQPEKVRKMLEGIIKQVYPSRDWKEVFAVALSAESSRRLGKHTVEALRNIIEAHKEGIYSKDLSSSEQKMLDEALAKDIESQANVDEDTKEVWAVGARQILDLYASMQPSEKTRGLTGRSLYRLLTKRLGSPKAASELLREHGILGIRYNGAQDGECAVVWDEASIKILHELEQAMGRDGSIRGAFQTGNNTIRLTPNANLSTFSLVQRSSVFLGLFQITPNGPRSLIF